MSSQALDWPSLCFALAGSAGTIIVQKTPSLLSWFGVQITTDKQLKAKRDQDFLDYLRQTDAKKDALIDKLNVKLDEYEQKLDEYEKKIDEQTQTIQELKHDLADLQIQVGANQESLQNIKKDSDIVVKTAAVVKNIVSNE
jgi:chromosome segregation ATPase